MKVIVGFFFHHGRFKKPYVICFAFAVFAGVHEDIVTDPVVIDAISLPVNVFRARAAVSVESHIVVESDVDPTRRCSDEQVGREHESVFESGDTLRFAPVGIAVGRILEVHLRKNRDGDFAGIFISDPVGELAQPVEVRFRQVMVRILAGEGVDAEVKQRQASGIPNRLRGVGNAWRAVFHRFAAVQIPVEFVEVME